MAQAFVIQVEMLLSTLMGRSNILLGVESVRRLTYLQISSVLRRIRVSESLSLVLPGDDVEVGGLVGQGLL